MKNICFALLFFVLSLLLIGNAFAWGQRAHPCIGGNATDWESGSFFYNANNGPDICHLILRDVGFAHNDIEFAETMVDVANKVSFPLIRGRMLKLAYGWGSHIVSDMVAHNEMFLIGEYDYIEHALVELAVDWWLWNHGSNNEQQCARNTTVTWNSWLVSETSKNYGKGIISMGEVNSAGFALVIVIAGEAILMIAPEFYNRAIAYSEDTSTLLNNQNWRPYYEDSIIDSGAWLSNQGVAMAPSKTLPKDNAAHAVYIYQFIQELGERAIELGGIQRDVSYDEYFSQVTISIKDHEICRKALEDLAREKMKAASETEKKILITLSGNQMVYGKTSTKWGEIKKQIW